MLEKFLEWLHPAPAQHLRDYLTALEARVKALEDRLAPPPPPAG